MSLINSATAAFVELSESVSTFKLILLVNRTIKSKWYKYSRVKYYSELLLTVLQSVSNGFWLRGAQLSHRDDVLQSYSSSSLESRDAQKERVQNCLAKYL